MAGTTPPSSGLSARTSRMNAKSLDCVNVTTSASGFTWRITFSASAGEASGVTSAPQYVRISTSVCHPWGSASITRIQTPRSESTEKNPLRVMTTQVASPVPQTRPIGGQTRRPDTPSLSSEEDRAHERLGSGIRVVGIDGHRNRRWLLTVLVVDLLVVLAHVAALGDPLAEVGGARTDHEVGDGAGLLALAHRAHWLARVPHVAEDARAYRLGEARPHHVDLDRLIVRRLLARVAVLRQHGGLPRPLEDRRLLDVHLAFDLVRDQRALVGALHLQGRPVVVIDDHEVVLGAAPALRLPPGRDTFGANGNLGPVFDEHLSRRTADGHQREQQHCGETCEHGVAPH